MPAALTIPEPTPASASPTPSTGPRGRVWRAVQRRGDALLAFASQGVSSLTNFLRLVFVARVCTEEVVGAYSLGLTNALLIAALCERLINAPYTVFAYRREPDQRPTLLGSMLVLALAASVAAAAASAVAGGAMLVAAPGSALGVTLLATALVIPAWVMREFVRGASFTHFEMWSAIAVDVATLVVQAALLWGAWSAGALGVGALYGVISVSLVAPTLYWLWMWRDRWTVDWSALRDDWSESWRFSRWLVVARLMGNGSRVLTPWVIFLMVGEAAAGRFAVCVGLVGLAWLFVRGLNNYFRPHIVRSFAEGGAAAGVRAVMSAAVTPTLFLAPACLLFLLAGDELLSIIYGDAFRGVESVVLILGLNTVVIAWATAAATGLLAIDNPRATLWVEGLTLVGTLAAVGLILPLGLNGAAWAMLAGNLCGVVAAAVMLARGVAQWQGPRSVGEAHG